MGSDPKTIDKKAGCIFYQATKGIPRKVNKLAVAALRLAAQRQAESVDEAVVLEVTKEVLL